MPHPCPAEEAGLSPHTPQASLGLTIIQEESCKSVRTVHPDSSFTATPSHWAWGPASTWHTLRVHLDPWPWEQPPDPTCEGKAEEEAGCTQPWGVRSVFSACLCAYC